MRCSVHEDVDSINNVMLLDFLWPCAPELSPAILVFITMVFLSLKCGLDVFSELSL